MQSPLNPLLTSLNEFVNRLIGAPRPCVIVVGCDARVRLLVTELGAAGKRVSQIKTGDGPSDRSKAPSGVNVFHCANPDVEALKRAGAKAGNCLVAATADDTLNVSLCREARERFGVPLVIARLGLLEGITNWARLNNAGMVRITWGDAVRAITGETVPTARLSRLASLSDREQIVDLEMRSPVFLGQTIADLPLHECEVAALTRKDIPLPSFDSAELCLGDVLTLIGQKAAISQVRETLTSL